MKGKKDKSTRKVVLVGLSACLFLIVAAPFFASRSLTGYSEDNLYQVVWSREGDAINYEVENNGSLSKTYPDMLARWNLIKQELIRAGADDATASHIVGQARGGIIRHNGTFPTAHWPVMARRGWILNKPVWIVVVKYPKNIKAPLKGNQLKLPLTRKGGLWDGQIMLFNAKGDIREYNE